MLAGAAAATLDYYAGRTDPDGPAMTDAVHAIDASAIDEPGCAAYTYLRRAYQPFARGPFALFSESRGDKAGASDPLAGSPRRTSSPARAASSRSSPTASPVCACAPTPSTSTRACRPNSRTAYACRGCAGAVVRTTSRSGRSRRPSDCERVRPSCWTPRGPPHPLRHGHPQDPAPRSHPHHRPGPLPPGDGDLLGLRPLPGGGGRRQPRDLLVPGRRPCRFHRRPGPRGARRDGTAHLGETADVLHRRGVDRPAHLVHPNGTPARYVRVSVRGGTGAALAELDVRS